MAPTPRATPERVEKAVYALLVAELAAALDVVEATWTAESDPLSLGDVVTWLRGYSPTVMEREKAEFPIITVWSNRQEGLTGVQERTSQWGHQQARYPVLINWFVAADTEAECNTMSKRFGEAIQAVLDAHERIAAGLMNRSYAPEIELSLVTRELPEVGGTLSGDVFYTQMGQLTVIIEGAV